ncbi:Glycoside hydrolase family 9, partial [Trinorchestia longiramus]
SILFYEAERSGALPPEQRILWRGDSAMTDGADNGVDLTGGYYDAGDHVKFHLPMTSTVTLLSWSAIAYTDGYTAAGQVEHVKEAIKWGTDYFLKCHTANLTFYAQVGDGDIDHAYWGRPEEMTMERPSVKIDAE